MLVLLILGTPEVGGLTSIQALEIVRGCRGLNIIGADLVEVQDKVVCTTVVQSKFRHLNWHS